MKYIKPNVKLLNKNSIDLNLNYKVWMKSREKVIHRDGTKLIVGTEVIENESEYIDRIIKQNLQYNNFVQIAFEVKGSVLFRDILFSINSTGQWAESLRFINSTRDESSGLFDEDSYPISEEYMGIPEWENQFNAYLGHIHKDKRTDNNRLSMPMSISSRYWISINLKELISFISMLKIKMPFFYEIYGKLFIECLKSELNFDIERYLVTYIDAGINQYFSRSEFNESYQEVDDLVILKTKLGMILYSQFLRQRNTIIKGLYDELVHDNINEFKHKVFYGNTELRVTYIADKEKFLRTVSTRCCNFSMSSSTLGNNSWSKVLDIILKNASIQEFIDDYLPCKFCGNGVVKCKFYDDVKFREEGLEKDNIKCPIYFKSKELAKEKIDRDQNLLSELYNIVVDKLTKGEL